MVGGNTMDTQFGISSGSRHPQTGVFSYYGELDEPSIGVHGRAVKTVIQWLDEEKKSYRSEAFDLHVADDYRVVEMVFTRKE